MNSLLCGGSSGVVITASLLILSVPEQVSSQLDMPSCPQTDVLGLYLLLAH